MSTLIFIQEKRLALLVKVAVGNLQLVRTMIRLYEPTSGEFLFDGRISSN